MWRGNAKLTAGQVQLQHHVKRHHGHLERGGRGAGHLKAQYGQFLWLNRLPVHDILNLAQIKINYTVTIRKVNFCYPDRVPLTQFVHITKKSSSVWAWNFCWVFCATGIFLRCNRKIFEYRLGANLRPSGYEADILPLRHCILMYRMLWHSLCSILGFSGRFCSYWKPNFPAVSGSYLLGFSGRICSYLQPNFPATPGVTCRDFPAVSAVTGSWNFRPYL
jgi:hypothetical protein